MPDPISPSGSSGPFPVFNQTNSLSLATSGGVPSVNGLPGVQGVPVVEGPGNTESVQSADGVDLDIGVTVQSNSALQEIRKESVPSLEDAAKTLKEFLKNIPSDVQFKRDDETGIVMIKVVNPLTREVIREFPPEEIVEMSRKLRKLSQQNQKSGVLFDEKS